MRRPREWTEETEGEARDAVRAFLPVAPVAPRTRYLRLVDILEGGKERASWPSAA